MTQRWQSNTHPLKAEGFTETVVTSAVKVYLSRWSLVVSWIMAIHLYHYTDSESLVKIVKEKLMHATKGSVLDPDEDESVFFTQKVLNILNWEWNTEKCVKSQNSPNLRETKEL